MPTLQDFKSEIQNIQDRNRLVESDKAWETSYTKRMLLTIFTYLAIGIYLRAIQIPDPWLHAIVPALAFMLSTLTLPFMKKLWLKYIHKK